MLLKNLKVFEIMCAIPFRLNFLKTKWDSKHRQMVLVNHKNLGKLNWLEIKIWIHTIITLVVAIQTLNSIIVSQSLGNHTVSFANGFLYGIALLMFFTTNLVIWSCFKLASTRCAFANGIVKLDYYSELVSTFRKNRNRSVVEKLNLLGAYLVLPVVTGFNLIYLFGLYWASPCKSSVAFYFLIPECRLIRQADMFWSFWIKALIFLINQWGWMFSLFTMQYVIGAIQVLCSLSFRGFPNTFNQIFDINNDNALHRSALFYRKIQVVNGFCNEVQQGVPMLAIMFGGIFVHAVNMTGFSLVPWKMDNCKILICFSLVFMYLIVF